MNIFETIMLICFGFAWPISIYKSYVSRETGGKSLFFLVVLQVGYMAGILFKVTEYLVLVKTNPGMPMSINLYLYILNLTMITIDECLYVRNRRIEKTGTR